MYRTKGEYVLFAAPLCGRRRIPARARPDGTRPSPRKKVFGKAPPKRAGTDPEGAENLPAPQAGI